MYYQKKHFMERINNYSKLMLEIIHARVNLNQEQLYEKLFEAITVDFKKDLIEFKPVSLSFVISLLIDFYKEREEYEKCQMLNNVGFEIYNTII